MTSRGFVATLRSSCASVRSGDVDNHRSTFKTSAEDLIAMKTKTTTKRGIRARKPVACPHDRLYACIAERDDGACGTFIVCTHCAFAIAVNDVVFSPPSLRPAAWLPVRPCEETDAGARITILAGPGAEYAPLALACIDERERRQTRALDVLYSEMEPLLPKTEGAEMLARLTAKRESLKKSHYSDIAKRFDAVREKVRATA